MTTCSPCPKINIEAEQCPEAVIEWYRLTGLADRKESLSRKDLALKAKQHLRFLDWKFWHVNKKGRWELRYTSPKSGKNYISLRKACESCIEDGGCSAIYSSTTVQAPPTKNSSFGEIDHSTFNDDSQALSLISLQKCNVTTISNDGASSTMHSSTTVQVPSTTISSSPLHLNKQSRDFGETDQSTFYEDSQAFGSVSLQNFNVATISEDGFASIMHSSTTVQAPSTTISSSPLHMNKQSRDFGEKDQSTFNEDSQAFGSLFIQKCNVTTISEDGISSTMPSSTTVPAPSTITSSSSLRLKKRQRDFGEIDRSTFNEDSEAFSSISLQKCNVITISTSKVNEKLASHYESKVSHSLHSAKRRKISEMGITDKVCDKNEKVLNMSISKNISEVCGKREEVLKMGLRAGCTFVSWLVKNRVLVPGTNVFCRGGNNIVKIGNIVFDGISCDCCHVNFNITGFEIHAGCTGNSPPTSILLEDGRSLLECQREALSFASLKG